MFKKKKKEDKEVLIKVCEGGSVELPENLNMGCMKLANIASENDELASYIVTTLLHLIARLSPDGQKQFLRDIREQAEDLRGTYRTMARELRAKGDC